MVMTVMLGVVPRRRRIDAHAADGIMCGPGRFVMVGAGAQFRCRHDTNPLLSAVPCGYIIYSFPRGKVLPILITRNT